MNHRCDIGWIIGTIIGGGIAYHIGKWEAENSKDRVR